MNESTFQLLLSGLLIPIAMFFIKLHADLVYKIVPQGFATLEKAFSESKDEVAASHNEAMEALKSIHEDLRFMAENWGHAGPLPIERRKSRPRPNKPKT